MLFCTNCCFLLTVTKLLTKTHEFPNWLDENYDESIDGQWQLLLKSSLLLIFQWATQLWSYLIHARIILTRSLTALLFSSLIFTALHGMQRGLTMRFLYRAAWNPTRSYDEISVCLSVCLSVRPSVLSVKRVCCDKTEEKFVQIFIPYERSFCLVLWEEEWLVGATHSIWNFGSAGPHWSEIADFEPIIARSASAVRPSEKSSINTNRKSPKRFPTSLRWSLYVAPSSPKGGLKNV